MTESWLTTFREILGNPVLMVYFGVLGAGLLVVLACSVLRYFDAPLQAWAERTSASLERRRIQHLADLDQNARKEEIRAIAMSELAKYGPHGRSRS